MKQETITEDQKMSSIRIKKEQFVFTTKRINEFAAQIEKIRVEDPFRYEREAKELQKQLLSLTISEYRQTISLYEKQNPKKFETKKDAMNAVLADLEEQYDRLVGKEENA